MTKNKMYRERTQYIDVEHFIWEIVARGEIIFRKIATDNIFPVDMLTKPTLLSKLKHCLDLIVLITVNALRGLFGNASEFLQIR